MRHFSYFLYENFDADREAGHPANPRRILNRRIDGILSRVADFPPRSCPAALLREEFGAEALSRAISSGALRESGGIVCYDTSIFLEEDVPALQRFSQSMSVPLAERLWERRTALQDCVSRIRNGFDPPANLYHVLCGMIFDGLFFDRLTRQNVLSVSRLHASGLDYLSVIYQDCDSLRSFSDALLCSYNRLTDGHTSLQSFGDADGSRFDFYRLFRLREQGVLPARYAEAGRLLDAFPKGREKQTILDQTRTLLLTGSCDSRCLNLLELLGYTKGGKVCVPVFSEQDTPVVLHLEDLAAEALLSPLSQALQEASQAFSLTPSRHGVSSGEIANELYHILFGGINEALAELGAVSPPPRRAGEGRYWQCIEWPGPVEN